MTTNQLTDEQKAAVLADFEQWSGGCVPHECTDEQIETYITHTADATLDEEALRHFLFVEVCKS